MTQAQQMGVTVCIAILTILGSGITSAVVNYKLNRLKEDRQMRLDRLERAYLTANRFFITIDCHFTLNHSMLVEQLTPEQVLDQTIKRGTSTDRPHDEAEMLVALYFPTLKQRFDEVLACRSEGNEVFSAFSKGRGTSLDCQIVFDDVVKKYEAAKIGFRDEARRIAHSTI